MLKYSLLSKEAKITIPRHRFFTTLLGKILAKFQRKKMKTRCKRTGNVCLIRWNSSFEKQSKMYFRAFFRCFSGFSLLRNRARIYKSSRKEVSNAVSGAKYQQSSLFRRYTRRFGGTLCNTLRDLKNYLKSAMEEATEIWTANPQKKPCVRKWEYQGITAYYH